MAEKAYFVSDLHLFSRRSNAAMYQQSILSAVEQAHTFILGGDIFDFRWSQRGHLEQTLDNSIHWLKRLMAANPKCHFHYLLGNHDCAQDFVERLDRLCSQTNQMTWHRHHFRLSNCVFLHGDIVDLQRHPRESLHHALDQKRMTSDQRVPPAEWAHLVYDVAVAARVHKVVVQFAKRQKEVLTRIANYLSQYGLSASSGVGDVYFGHTHKCLAAVPFLGMRFHNPGAAIKGLSFRITEVSLQAANVARRAAGAAVQKAESPS
jgi:UDP-2,3-diacylglucosamine hydrolase